MAKLSIGRIEDRRLIAGKKDTKGRGGNKVPESVGMRFREWESLKPEVRVGWWLRLKFPRSNRFCQSLGCGLNRYRVSV
jgi:hypothetical protein